MTYQTHLQNGKKITVLTHRNIWALLEMGKTLKGDADLYRDEDRYRLEVITDLPF